MSEILAAVSQLIAELTPAERSMLSTLLEASAPVGPSPVEPIAVVGLGCRFPGGASGPARFWRLLDGGVDAIGEIPADRFRADDYYDPDPDAPGKLYTRYGGFLDRVDTFDPHFFEISPREAAHMDPQQRILLEVAWEALEDAAQPPAALRRSRTGVFVGACSHDYEQLQTRDGTADDYGSHTLVGDLASVLAGRLSYSLGLEGPSLLVDTACSSSLVALHLACQSLRDRECHLALAGGVNVILSSDGFVKLSRMRALSPDGRCRAFDARANGYVRGEGSGVLVLKRLDDAERAGDRIWAVIRGSAINHDGRGAGLTAPNGLAQRDVVRAALDAAGVGPGDIDYVEAHGTGTPLGDPIEMEALRDVFGQARPDGSICAVGSVKSNIGHLEAAAGVAGVIKTILALTNEAIPKHLHFGGLNPRISLAGAPLAVADKPRAWPRHARPRLAGVSSFGLSGTNAHVVVGEPPAGSGPTAASAGHARQTAGPGTGGRAAHLLVLSARTGEALTRVAARYGEALGEADLPIADVCATAHTGRAHFAHRLAIVVGSTVEAADRLRAFAEGGSAGSSAGEVWTGVATSPAVVGFFYPGSLGAPAAWARLLDAEPVFRDAVAEIEPLVRRHTDVSLARWLAGAPGPLSSGGSRAALVGAELALTALWRSWGVSPGVVAGEGAGVLAAACAAGVLGVEDAIAIACGRSGPRPLGAAAAIRLVGPDGRALTGSTDSLAHDRGPGRADRADDGDGNATASGASGRTPVHAALREAGCGAEVDVSTAEEAALLGSLAALAVRGAPIDWAGFHAGRPGRRTSLPTYPFARDRFWLASSPDAAGRAAGDSAFARRRPSASPGHPASQGHSASLRPSDDPLLGHRVDSPLGGAQHQVVLDHRELGRAAAQPVLAAARELARAVHAASERIGGGAIQLDQVRFPEPLVVAGPLDRRLAHVSVFPRAGDAGAWDIATSSRALDGTGSDAAVPGSAPGSAPAAAPGSSPAAPGSAPAAARWVRHLAASGRESEPLRPSPRAPRPPAAGAPGVLERDEIDRRMAAAGLEPGRSACTIERVVLGPDGGTAAISLAPDAGTAISLAPDAGDLAARSSTTMASLLAAAVEVAVLVAADAAPPASGDVPILTALATLRGRAESGQGPWICSARAFPGAPGESVTIDLRLRDSAGATVAEMTGLVLRWIERSAALGELAPRQRELVRAIEWSTAEPAGEVAPPPGRWIVIGRDGRLSHPLAARLTSAGVDAAVVLASGEMAGPVAARLEGAAAVVDLRAVEVETPAAGWTSGEAAAPLRDVLALAQRLVDGAGARRRARLYMVTRGAVPHRPLDPVPGLFLAPLWGFGRGFAAEYPDQWGGLLDLDPETPPDEADLVARALLAEDGEPEAILRGGSRLVPRLVSARSLAADRDALLRPEAAYVITGGLGGLGMAWAAWMVERGARHLFLVGRRPPGDAARAALRSLAEAGARVRVVQRDVARSGDVRALLDEIDRSGRALAGVIHAAGTSEDAPLHRIAAERLVPALTAKVDGALCLAAALAERPRPELDFLVLFSSIAGLFGNPGQSTYAAANAFLDSCASELRARGLPALSIAWGPLAGHGLARDFAAGPRKRWGVDALGLADSLAVFARLIPPPAAASVAVVALDQAALAAELRRAARPGLLSGERGERTRGERTEPTRAERAERAEPLSPRPPVAAPDARNAEPAEPVEPADREAMLLQCIEQAVRNVLGLDPAFALPPEQRLDELGMDSMLALDLVAALDGALGTTLPNTLAMDHPTVAEIAAYLMQTSARPA